jgi:hypothetical protein
MDREEIAIHCSCLVKGIANDDRAKRIYYGCGGLWNRVADWHIAELEKAKQEQEDYNVWLINENMRLKKELEKAKPIPVNAEYFNREIEKAKQEGIKEYEQKRWNEIIKKGVNNG